MERTLGEDPSVVVIDEVVGMWISLILLPKTIAATVMAFLLFRLFDILKPPPARQSERFRNGWGIMTDDVVAGVYANLVGHGFIFVFPSLYLSYPIR
jgi:phosphatidylglycerophosphatase A